MNTAIQCITLLACAVFCTSVSIKNCQCPTSRTFILPSRIADVKKIDPRPYCNKEEVIVTLKNGDLECLDPKEKFTKAVLKAKEKIMADKAARMNSTRPKTTTAPARVTSTSS